jgi:chromosome segregation ATPase
LQVTCKSEQLATAKAAIAELHQQLVEYQGLLQERAEAFTCSQEAVAAVTQELSDKVALVSKMQHAVAEAEQGAPSLDNHVSSCTQRTVCLNQY